MRDTFTNPPMGISGMVSPQGQVFTGMRDLGNCIPGILANAVSLAYNSLSVEYPDRNEQLCLDLNTISHFLCELYDRARKDHKRCAPLMAELLDYVEKSELGKECFMSISAFCMIGMFTYLFGSAQTSIKAPESINEDVVEFGASTTALACLPAELRDTVLEHLRSVSMPDDFRFWRSFSREASSYLSEIQEKQRQEMLDS